MMQYERCARCGDETIHNNRVTIDANGKSWVYRLCPDCRMLVEEAIRHVIDETKERRS